LLDSEGDDEEGLGDDDAALSDLLEVSDFPDLPDLSDLSDLSEDDELLDEDADSLFGFWRLSVL
jgi:hypothetical protein